MYSCSPNYVTEPNNTALGRSAFSDHLDERHPAIANFNLLRNVSRYLMVQRFTSCLLVRVFIYFLLFVVY